MGKNAFAFIVMRDNATDKQISTYNHYFMMVLVAVRKMREVGYTEDMVLISNCEQYKQICEAEWIIFEYRPMFDYKALQQYRCQAWHLSLFDMQKLYYWSISQYDNILALDADILPTNDRFCDWHIDGLGVICGHHSGINSSMMLLRPNEITFKDMASVLATANFDSISGWNNIGPIKTPCGTTNDWEFQAANAAQGFIPYYFRDQLVFMGDRIFGKFVHYGGASKYLDKYYLAEYKRLLSKMYN